MTSRDGARWTPQDRYRWRLRRRLDDGEEQGAVTCEDVEVRNLYPDKTFTLIAAAAFEESIGEEYRLGIFDISAAQR